MDTIYASHLPLIQVNVAGVGSGFPDRSIALTLNVCTPLDTVYVIGLEHVEKAPESSLHSNPEIPTLSRPLKVKVTVACLICCPLISVLP